jgi:t-SNARE complex subunit (syntaxin)
MRAEGDALPATSEKFRPFKAHYRRLYGAFVAAIQGQQAAKHGMRQVQTETLLRRGKIVWGAGDGRTDSEMIAEIERNPTGFLADALMEEASTEASQAYVDASSRARDVEVLVRSINEVSEMFRDMSVLVQNQSEMLDNIGMCSHDVLTTCGNPYMGMCRE